MRTWPGRAARIPRARRRGCSGSAGSPAHHLDDDRGRDRAAGALRAVEVAGRGVDRDRRGAVPPGRRWRRGSRRVVRPEAWPGARNRKVDPDGLPAGRRQVATTADEHRPGGRCPRRPIAGREAAAEVAADGRREQGVGKRVQRDIAVRVARQPGASSMRMPPSASPSPGPNGWLSWPWPMRGGPSRRARIASARSESAGVVTLRFAASPGTVAIGMPSASRAASSVTIGRRRSTSETAAAPADHPAASARERARRARRSRTMRSGRSLERLNDGPTGTAAPCSTVAAATASTSGADANGRAPSWTSTMAAVAADDAGATESGRSAPPATTGRLPQPRLGASASIRSARATTITRATDGAATIASTDQRSTTGPGAPARACPRRPCGGCCPRQRRPRRQRPSPTLPQPRG